ncbi:MAG TPA: SCO family protein [Pyrinomonadaceae bacterium]|jgi:protein SCO1/2
MFWINNSHNWRAKTIAARMCRGVTVLMLLLCAISSPRVLAQHHHAHDSHDGSRTAREARESQSPARGKPGVIEVGDERLEIPDVKVLNQDGRKVRFYSDLIKDKVVVMNFFFTSCSYICPKQGRALDKLHAGLAGRLGKDVFFVSVSKDPATDKPERLKRWGAKFNVGRGWTLVTGGEDVMKKLLLKFTGDNPGPQMHDSVILIGNDRTGIWTAVEGLAETEELVQIINRVSSPVAALEK